jgi:uncharacterized protein (TIGR02594 family)
MPDVRGGVKTKVTKELNKIEKLLDNARGEIGKKEWGGRPSNPEIEKYYTEAVGKKHFDSVPWCAAFVGAMLVRSGFKSSGSLMARSYTKYGKQLTAPIPGAIVVFPRGKPPSGHVAIVERVTPKYVEVIGGNQSDQVSRKKFLRSNILRGGIRWPI